ncbi:MAG: hypothetical protein KF842_01960 [Caulobacter sp.]|nr:hypothetical protein [Caulobacter sp.]
MLLREMQRQKGRTVQIIALVVLVCGLVAAGIGLGFLVREVGYDLNPVLVVAVDLVALLIFTIMVSSTLARAAQVLYLRDDLDLLLSSPLPPGRILAVRFAGIAFSVTLFWLVLAAGLLAPIAVIAAPALLAVLPVLLALGLVASAVGLLLTTLLFRLIGPRRTRTLAQVLSALIGASLFLSSQLPNILRGKSESYSRWGWLRPYFTGEAHLDLPPHADLIARAAVGQPIPLLLVLAVSLVFFMLVTGMLGRQFARDAASAIGSDPARRVSKRVTGAFAAGAFAATLRKELRLLMRDISLFSQVLLRVLYMLPLAFVFVRNASAGDSLLLPTAAAAMAVMAGQLSSSFTWITVSAEDAPDLLVAAPASMSLITRAKLWAALIPTAVLVAIPLLAVGLFAPLTALVSAAGCFASAWACGVVNIWRQRPGRRADFRRRGNVNWVVAFAILGISGLIGGATFLAASGMTWAILPAVLAAVLTLAMRRSDKQIRERLRDEA